MLLGSVWQRRTGFFKDMDLGELRGIPWHADCSTRQICWNHDWTRWTPSSLDGTPKKFIWRVLKINASTKSLVERLCDLKIYTISVLSFIGSVCAPDKATLKGENHAFQCTTAGPCNSISSKLLEVGSVCGLGLDLVGIHSISLAARYRVAACSTTLTQGLEKSQCGTWAQLHSSLCSLPLGNMSFLFPPWPSTQRVHLILFVDWTAMTHLLDHAWPRSWENPHKSRTQLHSYFRSLSHLGERISCSLHGL